MTDHACLACGSVHPGARDVTLHDGRIVSNFSEDWRHETEARAILAMPTSYDRRAQMNNIERIRGTEAADALRSTVKALWNKQRAEIDELRNQVDAVAASG